MRVSVAAACSYHVYLSQIERVTERSLCSLPQISGFFVVPHLVSPHSPVVDVERDHGHGAGERHQADGHAVVETCE